MLRNKTLRYWEQSKHNKNRWNNEEDGWIKTMEGKGSSDRLKNLIQMYLAQGLFSSGILDNWNEKISLTRQAWGDLVRQLQLNKQKRGDTGGQGQR